MSAGRNGSNAMAYRPTSLDFINRPNPVEPHALPENHPLNGTQRLGKISRAEFLHRTTDHPGNPSAERPAKRRKSGDGKLLDLPRLPAVKNETKRLRIPPTLSGLHQPPPNAGILPSISVDQPINLPNRVPSPKAQEPCDPPQAAVDSGEPHTKVGDESQSRPKTTHQKPKRKKWSDDETAHLLKGVARFGIGNWTQILNCPDYHFEGRTALDLKDRFRVCCPDEYKTNRAPKKTKAKSRDADGEVTDVGEPIKTLRPNRSDRKSSSELLRLGIKGPFEKSSRRRRTDYSEAEDEALLDGFKKHGNSWAAIREDPELDLVHRKATDLRDRFRTKFPEMYEKAGLAPRRDVGSKKDTEGPKANTSTVANEGRDTGTKSKQTSCETEVSNVEASRVEKENKMPQSSVAQKKQTLPSLLHYDPDVFWGAPFDPDEPETERITLDRRILDWPLEASKASNSRHPESLAAFNFQKQPSILSHTSTTTPGKTATSAATLPSLAAITSGSDDFTDQLELPSLMGVFAALDGDSRSGGQFPSLEELLK